MIIIAAADERNGMMFNSRRVSQDKKLRQKILAIANGSVVRMNSYSEKQFGEESTGNIKAGENFLEEAKSGDFCFVENDAVAPFKTKVEKIILFKWNRKYPADFYFDIDVCDGNWSLESTEDFQGTSHERITMEVYSREKK